MFKELEVDKERVKLQELVNSGRVSFSGKFTNVVRIGSKGVHLRMIKDITVYLRNDRFKIQHLFIEDKHNYRKYAEMNKVLDFTASVVEYGIDSKVGIKEVFVKARKVLK